MVQDTCISCAMCKAVLAQNVAHHAKRVPPPLRHSNCPVWTHSHRHPASSHAGESVCGAAAQDTRIARGDGGSVFVMVKEVSFASAPDFEAADIGTSSDIAFGATTPTTSSASYGSTITAPTAGYGPATTATTGAAPTSAGGYANEVIPPATTTSGNVSIAATTKSPPTSTGGYADEVTPVTTGGADPTLAGEYAAEVSSGPRSS